MVLLHCLRIQYNFEKPCSDSQSFVYDLFSYHLKLQLIYSTVDEYLGFFQFGDIMNNAYKNIFVHVLMCICTILVTYVCSYLEVESLGYRIGSASVVITEQFPKWLY